MSSRVHALAIPYPLESHCIAMANLSMKLASKGIIITFVSTRGSYNSERYMSNIATENNTLGIRSAEVSDGLPMDFDRSVYNEGFLQSMLNNMVGPIEELIHCLNKNDPKISCIVADSFLPWALLIAKKFSLPLVSLWTQSTVLYSIYYHSDMLISNGHFPSKGQGQEVAGDDGIDYIPGVPPLNPTDLPSFLQSTEMSDFMLHVIFLSFQSIREADWVLTNSVYELETETIDYLMHSKTPFRSVGPLLPSGYFDNHGANSSSVEFDFSMWLDSKPQRSIVYISFGNSARVSKTQIEEIAMGLLESQYGFLWMLSPQTVYSNTSSDHHITEILPSGFLEKIKDYGLIVTNWSHQQHLAVLSHESVGGFFTHCDWNSILESLCMGIPMLGFPLYADQYTNCKLLSDEMHVALKGKKGGVNGELVAREDIARNVKALMQSEQGRNARKKMERLRNIARQAASSGGSSDRNINNFVEELATKILHNN